jgi:hypothetical protein
MFWQDITVYLIIATALIITSIRIFRFFASQSGKCDGCSGCALKDIKKGIPAGKRLQH